MLTEGNGLSPVSFYMADKTEPYFLMPEFFQTSMSSLLCTLYASTGFFYYCFIFACVCLGGFSFELKEGDTFLPVPVPATQC